MAFSPAGMAVIKLGASLALLLAGVRLRLGLALSILGASVFLGFVCGLSPLSLGLISITTPGRKDFALMAGVVFLVVALSRIQDATGQNKRLVEGMSRRLPWPGLRLILFPALIGLLPVPGGALFSCPMLKTAAGTLPVDDRRLTLVNYWFRHVWELACPLYPGYLLVSSLLGLPLFALARLTFPLVFLSIFVGWFFFLRDLKSLPAKDISCPDRAEQAGQAEQAEQAGGGGAFFGSALRDLAPLLAVFGGMAVYWQIFRAIWPSLPSQYAFIAALLTGVGIALVQGRKDLRVPAAKLFFNKDVARVLFLILVIFIFKEVIAATGIVTDLAGLHLGVYGLYFLFFILPFACGALMGIMVGYVGTSIPILMSLIIQTGLQEHTAPLIILALVSGNCGQLLSPLHICLAVTCEFFQVRLGHVWGRLFRAVSLQFAGSLVWILALYIAGASF